MMKSNDRIEETLKANRNAALKSADRMAYLYAALGLLSLSILFLCFAVMNVSYYFIILGLAVFAGMSLVTFPFLFGVTLCASDATRFVKKKYRLKEIFSIYYRRCRTIFDLWSVLWKTFLGLLGGYFFGIMVMLIVIRYAWPELFNILSNFAYDSVNGNLADLDAALGSYKSIFYSSMLLALSFGNLIPIYIGWSELRKNENCAYAANALVAGGEVGIDITSNAQGMTVLFRREVLPTVRHEFAHYDFLLNWPGYAVFLAAYGGFVVLGLFFPQIPYYLTPFLALSFASLCYSPFYFREKLSAIYFYLGYSDKMLARCVPQVRNLILHMQDSMKDFLAVNRAQEETDDAKPQDDASEKEAKEGKVNPEDGSIDFTDSKKDDDKKDRK